MKFTTGNLQQVKDEMRQKVNTEAANLRLSIVTLDPGMAMVYADKRLEAENYFASNGTLGPAETPYLRDEAEVFGVTIFEKAQEVISQAQVWANLSAKIEMTRVWSNHLIDKATTSSDAYAAGDVDWPSLTSYL